MKNKSNRVASAFRSLLLASSFLIVISCHDGVPSVKATQTYTANSYSGIFEGFWNGMNTGYLFWDIDKTDWDQAYATYQPLFAGLKTFNATNDKLAEQYFTEMTATLVDSHYTLTFENTKDEVMPALNRKLSIDKQYPDSIYSLSSNFFINVLPKNYLDQASIKIGTDTVLSENSKIPFTVVTGTINQQILYFRLNYFYLSRAGINTTPVLNSFFAALANSSGLKGIVIDVRDNGGGDAADLNRLVGKMVTTPFTYGYTHSKSGIGRLDYTPWAQAIVTPQSGATSIQNPIVILADHTSISMAELTTLAIKTLPNGKFIGTTTWGANGPIISSTYLNGGEFTVGATSTNTKGYMFVYTSSVAFKALDGTSFEGRGISPDMWVPETGAAYNAGIDLQLAAAINYINSK